MKLLYCAATSAIVLINILVISSSPIESTSEDEAFYNRNADQFGGPVSPKMYEIHPQLAYLGHFNEKFWYIERTNFTYNNARSNCTQMGMSIARTDSQDELNFLNFVTNITDVAWVGAALPMRLSSFIWEGTDNEYPSTLFTPITTFALRLQRPANALPSLIPAVITSAFFALCTIP